VTHICPRSACAVRLACTLKLVTQFHYHAVVSTVQGSSKPHRRTRSLREAETSPTESFSSDGRKRILPFWGHKKTQTRGSHIGPVDDGHSPRHTAQLFVAKNYNLSQNAVSYDRGVLEDTLLNLEVFITRMFENLRVILRSVLLVPARNVKQPEAAKRHIRRASFQDMVRIFCAIAVMHAKQWIAEGQVHQ
jgi:hypothetical protein